MRGLGGDGGTRLRRVLVSAYSCGPGQGSEPGSGWQLARAAAQGNEVWLVTRRRFAVEIDTAIATDPVLRERLHVRYLELPEHLVRLKRGAFGVYWYYLLWQRLLGNVARAIHADVGIDVAHHVTFASDWLPVGLVRLPDDVPLVWGPVGGATYAPRETRRWLGLGARVSETVRGVLTRAARRRWGDPIARRAALVVAHNGDVAARFASRPLVIEPNPAITPSELALAGSGSVAPIAGPRAVFVGRLVSWKGTRLALEAVAALPEWRLDFIGSGPDERYLRRAAKHLGVSDRVRLHGLLPRHEVLTRIRDANALLLPSMHDSASWVTAEAVSLGTPVVCLDVGGPPLVMDGHGIAVAPRGDVVPALAHALQEVRRLPRVASTRWHEARLPRQVDDWYRRAQEAAGAAEPVTSA